MSRFYYYLVFINMLSNIIASVPAILLQSAKKGSVSAMILAVVGGTLLVTFFSRFFSAFPGMTLPALLKKTTSKWFYNPFILLLAVLWFCAGLITLTTFAFILFRFLTPEMPVAQVGLTLTLSVIFGSLMKTERVLYTVELILLMTFPLILFVFYKAYTSNILIWDFVMEAASYVNQIPNGTSFSSCFFLFLGVANLFIFNRFFTQKQNFGWKQIAIIGITSAFTLFTTYFIPIGFNGLEGVDELVYPWILTSDALRLDYFLIERIQYVFILFYLGIAFLSILIHWHVSMEFLKFVFNLDQIKYKGLFVGKYIPVPFFVGTALLFMLYVDEYQLYLLTSIFYIGLIFFFLLLVILFLFIKRRLKYANQAKQN